MGAPRSKIPFTYEDYKSLPESLDRRYELMDGELLMVPAPTTTHQTVLQNIQMLLVPHVRSKRLGLVLPAPVDVVLGEGQARDVLQPDVIYVSAARAAIVTQAEVAGAPDLVIEVLSPGTAGRDQGYKKKAYERAGVREYWIVDPQRQTVEVHRSGAAGFEPAKRYAGDDSIASEAVPGWRARLAEVFAGWD